MLKMDIETFEFRWIDILTKEDLNKLTSNKNKYLSHKCSNQSHTKQYKSN